MTYHYFIKSIPDMDSKHYAESSPPTEETDNDTDIKNNTFVSMKPIKSCFICKKRIHMIMDTQTQIKKGECSNCKQQMMEILDIPDEKYIPKHLTTNKLPLEIPINQTVTHPSKNKKKRKEKKKEKRKYLSQNICQYHQQNNRFLKLFGPDDSPSYIPKSADQFKRFLELFDTDDPPYIPKNCKWKYPRKI